jgi:transposase
MNTWIGLDVSKATLAVWLRPAEVSFDESNDKAGFQVLLGHLGRLPARLADPAKCHAR